jgi:hypothetical protein
MTGAKHNNFDYPIAWPDYLRLLRAGLPEQLLPYHLADDTPSNEEMTSAGIAAMSEMRIGD